MSCCPEKTGLALLAEDPAIVLFSYLCALLPLATIYALDFVTERWKSIRDTRRDGIVHLAFSIPPLTVVVFYIHLQRIDGDYKEMATAITAAILCILHVLRTMWGLSQLHVFKKWNIRALHVLARMGFDFPIYKPLREISGNSDDSNDFFPLEKSELPSSRIATCFSPVIDGLRRLLGLEKMYRLRQPYSWDEDLPASSTAQQMERAVDHHMIVNSSLVDNEFFGADLPIRPNLSSLRNVFSKSSMSLSDLLTPINRKECAVRWIVSFLARFGSNWLAHTKDLERYKKTVRDDGQTSADLPDRLAAFIAFNVTHSVDFELNEREEEASRQVSGTVEVESQDGGTFSRKASDSEEFESQEGTSSQQVSDSLEVDSKAASSQQVSILSPFHVMCSDLTESWNSTLKVTEKNALPYQMRGGSENEELNFEDYAVNIRNTAQAWHNDSLNELKEDEEKDAVLNMKPHQVACFSKLIEEENSQMLPISRERVDLFDRKMEKQRFNTFLWQLGQDTKPVDENCFDVTEVSSTLFDAFPVLKESLRPSMTTSPDCPVLQANVHADNWIALDAGKISFIHDPTQLEDTLSNVFEAQKHGEFRRLQLETAKLGCAATTARNIRFLGGLMEYVRSSLAYWVRFRDSEGFHWSTPVDGGRISVVCSDQLNDVLAEAYSKTNVELGNERSRNRLKCLHMRILWELQQTLIRSDTNLKFPNSAHLMILCMLAYPALHVSKVHDFPRDSNSRAISNIKEDRNRNVVIRVDEVYKIAIVGAPQPLHLIFEWNSESKNANVRICCNEKSQVRNFSWKCWKDGFMGRITAQSEWRTKHLDMKLEKIREEACVSNLTEGFALNYQCGNQLEYWKGWPPFRSEITGFEMILNPIIGSHSELDAALDLVAGRHSENASDEAHQVFLRAKQLSDNGQVREALPLFVQCIQSWGHSLALDHCVSDVVKNFRNNEKLVNDLLVSMYFGWRRISTERAEIVCREFELFDLKKVIEQFDKVHKETLYSPALALKGLALFLCLENEDTADQQCAVNTVEERCAEAFESYLILDDKRQLFSPASHFCLAIIYSRKYFSNGHLSDKEVALQHFMTICEFKHSDKTDLFLDIALLLEKGSFSKQEYEGTLGIRKAYSPFWPEEAVLDSIFQKIVLRSSDSQNRSFRNVNAARAIYLGLLENELSSETKRLVRNRLDLLRHEGFDEFAADFDEVSTANTIGEKSLKINARCN